MILMRAVSGTLANAARLTRFYRAAGFLTPAQREVQPPNPVKRSRTNIPTLLSADILALRLQVPFRFAVLWRKRHSHQEAYSLDGACTNQA